MADTEERKPPLQMAEEKRPEVPVENSIEDDADRAYQNVLKEKAECNQSDVDDDFDAAFDATADPQLVQESKSRNEQNCVQVRLAANTCITSTTTEVACTDMPESRDVNSAADVIPSEYLAKSSSPADERINSPPAVDVTPSKEENSFPVTKVLTGPKSNALSPTNSVSSHPSSTSSEPSWSTDMRFSLPQERRGKLPKPQSLEEAKEEWDQVETVTAGSKAERMRSPMVSFQDAITHFESTNLQEYAANIKPTVKRGGLGALWHMVSGPPSISNALKNERDLVFTLGLCPFDNGDSMHNRILQTVYKKLTASDLDCPRHGSHWEVIGFQGEDPATDLRGCGMLGLLNILFLCSDVKTQSLCRDIYRLSQDEVQNFPFCVMGINITRIALQLLREGKLNKECNQRRQVFEVFNELYAGIFLAVYRIWKTQQKTISDSGFVLREVELAAKKNPGMVSKQLQKRIMERSKVSDSPVVAKAKGATAEKVDKFSGICDLDQHEEEEIHLV